MSKIIGKCATFGELLYECRSHQRLSQVEASRTIGVASQTWSSWEQDKLIPAAKYAHAFALLWALDIPRERKANPQQSLLLGMIGLRFTLEEMGETLGITFQAVNSRISRDPVLRYARDTIRKRKGLWLTNFHPAQASPRPRSTCRWNEAVHGSYCINCNRDKVRNWKRKKSRACSGHTA